MGGVKQTCFSRTTTDITFQNYLSNRAAAAAAFSHSQHMNLQHSQTLSPTPAGTSQLLANMNLNAP